MISLVKPLPDAPHPTLEPLVSGLSAAERDFVLRAYEYVLPLYEGKLLGTGENTLDHALGLTANLAGLRLDAAARAAGLLFAVPEYRANAEEELAEQFDATVANLVSGVWKLNRLRVVTRGVANADKSSKASQAEILRKMLLGMVEDIRVVLIRLASRTQTLRYLAKNESLLRNMIGQETLDIYAPLANRLGVWQLKWELEDLSFRLIDPDTYKKIARMLDERRGERESFIGDAIDALKRELHDAEIAAEVTGRPKHLYSIYNKMRSKGLDFDELYDVRGLRVLVDDVRDCYTVLGLVHNMWTPIPGEFDDYISRPKANNYRSLHTAVMGSDGRALEVQIRTHEMHRHAELGVAAHWRYKETSAPGTKGAPRGDTFDDKIAWLRQVLAWRDEVVDSAEWVEQAKRAALDDTVYVFTPQGRVIDLPAGATPVDFAYALHTDLGHRCRGAKVDGVMVPLDYKLKNGQSVEIVSAKTGGPSRDWLNTQLGYLQSSRARNKVRQYFNAEEMARTIAAGRALVEKEMQREGATKTSLDQLAQALGFAKTEDFFAAVGREEIGPRAIQTALRGNEAPAQAEDQVITHKSKAAGDGGILIVGVDRLMTQLARCCKPVPPDPIVGFVTRGRGISVHRHTCKSLAHLLTKQPERAIEAQWGAPSAGKVSVYPVDILVQANDRQGLLRDISEVLSKERINVTAVNTLSRQSAASMAFTTEVSDLSHLRRAMAQIEEVNGVVAVRRR
ncbi:MAG TPA: bifunctional (p)ppGpp synthetase/guanosine-3',5'-bis(diphosphate) 3'-pyrophosphohydrolase [Burkholderiales bacterium]|nr:bifunctional (p)ppGpp synthetase/guanosine-3',5'-bis(diphosphate) 3'-pyrophosphohydrolase [Burkholderiales bacterium]